MLCSRDLSACSRNTISNEAAQGAQIASVNVQFCGGVQSVIFRIRGKQMSVGGQFTASGLLGLLSMSQNLSSTVDPLSALHVIVPLIVDAVSCPQVVGQFSNDTFHLYDSECQRQNVNFVCVSSNVQQNHKIETENKELQSDENLIIKLKIENIRIPIMEQSQ